MGEEKEGKTLAFLFARRKGDESRAQHSGSEEDDGRLDLPKTDGVAS